MRYFIITFGCQMNKSDSERIASVLENAGSKPTSNINEADLIVVNMCSVRQSAVDRVYGLIPKFEKLKVKNKKHAPYRPAGSGTGAGLKVILTGCILKSDRKKFAKEFDSILNIKDLLKERPKYQTHFSAFVPVSSGCNNGCSYCVVPFTRGRLVCRNHKEILKEVEGLVKNGFKEIWLLGQNVNAYQNFDKRSSTEALAKVDKSVNFAKLLKMINAIPGNFLIRFMSPHPADFSDELIDVMAKSEKIAKYLHLPVQSGDNEILKKMNRPYTVEQYKNLVKKIRKKIPEINLSTDVIVGFPGETKKQFKNTVKLFKEMKFNIAYISRYSPRSGTTAFKLKNNVSHQEKKRRYKLLTEILKEYG